MWQMPEEKFEGIYKTMAKGVNDMVNGHITVKKKAMACVAEFAKGNFDAELEKFPGKKAFINENIELLRSNVKAFIADMERMSKEHNAGDIDVVIPEDKFEGAYRVMAKGVNDMVHGHISVKKKAMACISEFSKGNLEAELEKFPGKKAFINENIERLRAAVKALIADADLLVKAAVEGKLATRADASKHQGDYRKIVQGVNDTLDAVIGPLNVAAKYVDQISKGDIPAKITDTYKGDFNEIKNNLNMCIDAVNALVADANLLSKAAVEGKLATRADASKHQGDYRKIVQGVNDTLDAVIGPLNVAAKYVDEISKGNIPAKITDTYKGDFNEIKNNLNACIDAVNALVADANLLSKAAVEGKLATRADASKHQGDYRKIVQGVDDCLDAVIGPLNVAAKYVDQISKGDIPAKITDAYKGDFNEIKNNLNMCIDAVNALVAEASALVKAAGEGKLATRADATKHQGDYRKIVQGVNEMLDAILLPIGEGNRVLAQISKRQDRRADRANLQGRPREDEARREHRRHGTARFAEGTGGADRGVASGTTFGTGQTRPVPGRLRGHREGCQRDAGCHPAAHRRRQPHSGPDLQWQDRRTDRPNLQGRPREDEAGCKQRRHRRARLAEGAGAADRCLT